MEIHGELYITSHLFRIFDWFVTTVQKVLAEEPIL